MLRSRNVAIAFALSFALVSLLLALSAPASRGAAPVVNQMSSLEPAPAPVACGQSPADLSILEADDGGICSAQPSAGTLEDPMRGGRTCRCSCGFPCKTDADCGGGIGSCRGGISCC
jgi:hypothetical protein